MSRFGKNSGYFNTAAKEEYSSVLFNFLPNPGSDATSAQATDKAEIITSLQKRVRDLNEPNKMTKTVQDGVCLYQTTEMYGKVMSVEGIVEAMRENDLTLRVTFRRPGFHSSSTLFELNPGMLDQLVSEEEDDHGTKMMELRVKAEASAENPRNGSMFISIEPKKGLHYFTNVDYRIDNTYDQIAHR